MWLEELETIQTFVNGEEIVLKKEGKTFAHRPDGTVGDWIQGLPKGMVWADAQALFEDSL